ncbi:MAG: ABC transporter ATP-binding protein [Chloroflexi bacterium]|jgi:simple sugar transport system ATP-binding protein|nr:ABC transporter ATP-binding protein [Chloroflexota bacterium]
MEMRGITKRFPGVLASDNVDFDVRTGEVHALLGENGAGKSTLMKVLYGMYHPDEGEIWLNGKRVDIASPTDAINLGIGMIHQHFMLVETLTVAENVALGMPSSRGPLTDLDNVTKRILELADIYGLQVDPQAYIWQLSVGQQQKVEIIKALYRGAALLILDEPTAVLTPQEVDEFFVIMRQMTKDGHGLIFISHKLHEVIEICQRVTVLRDGRMVGTRQISETTKEDLASWMVGREIGFAPDRGHAELGEIRLELKNVSCKSDRGTPGLSDVDLEVRSGEILGIAGVSGNGQRELAEVITGLRKTTQGEVYLEGEDISSLPPGDRTDRMLSYIPEERMRDGMIQDFTIAENMILREHHKQPFSRFGFLNLRQISHHSERLIEQFRVKTPSQETMAKSLSGGNIQKVVLAREISRQPRAIVAAQPTRGLDIGATEYVREQLLAQRRSGTAVLLISEDLDEILTLSDRIAVIFEGQIMGIVPAETATPAQLGLLMAGVTEEEGVQTA